MGSEAEDEFAERDAQGLQPPKADGPRETEAEAVARAQASYMKMIYMQVPIAQLLLATATYYALTLGWEPHSATPAGRTVGAKLQLIADHDLQWVYFAVWIIGLGRSRLMVNANAMRAGARLDRPDQHIYRTMDQQTRGQDVPYVLMANTGSAGRFNRAQRGVFNTDESMPLLLMNTLLAGAAFGGIVMALGLIVCYGRVTFGLSYTEAKSKRGKGLMLAFLGEAWMGGLVLFAALASSGLLSAAGIGPAAQ